MKEDRPRAAIGHMPFRGHRTVAEVREHEARNAIMRSLTNHRPRTGQTVNG